MNISVSPFESIIINERKGKEKPVTKIRNKND